MTNLNNTVLYTGMTSDLIRRVEEHKNHDVNGFTSKYNVSKLVYYEVFNNADDAINREKLLKRWRRSWKEELINKENIGWKDLSEDF